jgi:hypothetical protein
MEDYQAVNRETWDERVPAHLASPDYQVRRYAEDPGFLSHVGTATRDGIVDALTRLAGKAGPDDVVTVYSRRHWSGPA